MTNLNIIAKELKNQGFVANLKMGGVFVELNTRTVGKMEVEIALDQVFDGIDFNLSRIYNGVLVKE